MKARLEHLRIYHHLPVWRLFDRVLLCERCIKPPSRGLRFRVALAPSRLYS